MKRICLVLFLQFSAWGAFAQWTNLGLNAHKVNDLTIYADTLYASTSDGIYKKHKSTPDSVWVSCGMQGEHVVQTLVENHQTFYSMVTIAGTPTNQLYKSENGGITFELMTESVSNMNYYQYLDHMAHPPNDFSTLYLVNHQLKTDDGGASWVPLGNSQNTDRFILVNPSNPAQIIIGGEADLFNPILQVSNDYGDTWGFPAITSFFSGDNAIHDLAMVNGMWFATGEGVICKTIDEGENWEQLLNVFEEQSIFSLYYTNIDFSPVNSDILYVTGHNNTNANEVPLLISDNLGATWDSLSYLSPPSEQRVYCLTVDHIDNSDYVFIGGKGVYLYKRMISGLANIHAQLDFNLFPNPTATGYINVTFPAASKGLITASIFDLQGRLVSQESIATRGKQTSAIDTSALPRGAYVLQLKDEEKTGSREFVVR